MTKLGALRCLGECALGGGCIAGGVECAKMKTREQMAFVEVEQLKLDNKSITENYDAELDKNKKLDEGIVCAKKVIEYSKLHFSTIGGSGQEASKLTQHARDAKFGVKNIMEDKTKGCPSTPLKSYSEGLNWN